MLTAGEGVFARTSLNAHFKNVFIFYFLNFFSFFYLFFLLNEHLNQIHSLVGCDRVENIASSLIQVHWTQESTDDPAIRLFFHKYYFMPEFW